MWWNSSSHGRHRSPSTASVSPIPFSSSRELFEDPDPEWVGGQLEQARLQRAGFYRRLQSASQRSDDDIPALQKSKKISPDGFDDVPSFEPHTSWRFYTSFDNGEWKRHAVPVLKAEEATTSLRDCSQKSRESDLQRSACQAAESSLRRARHPRTTAADRQQARLRMRSGESGESSAYGRWRLSSSAETFRNTATGGSLTDLRRISPEAYHHGFNSLDTSQVLSPSSDRFGQWSETTSPVGLLPRPRFDADSSPKALLPAGSCTVDGVDVTFQEKFIIPTKYKNRENNTAAGTPETSKAEVPRSTPAELKSGNSNEDPKNSVEGASASCMTGQGEVQTAKLSEQRDMILLDRVASTRLDTEEKRVTLEPPGVSHSVRTNDGLDFTGDLKHKQFAIVSQFVQENSFNEFSENSRIIKDSNKKSKAQTTHLTINGSYDSSPNPEPTYARKETIPEHNQKPHSGNTLSSKTTSVETENKCELPSGRSLVDDVKGKQKAELTSNVAASLETGDQKASSSGDKIVKFVSIFFADVNEGLKKDPSNTKHKLSNFVVADTMEESPGLVNPKADPVVCEEDDNWVVEVAVKN